MVSVGVSCKGKISVVFVAFKELMILNLAQRSFKVIHFGGNRKSVYDLYIGRKLSLYIQTFRGYCRFYTPRANCVSK